jgi:transcriptional regulator with XRE-family HTH domain
MAGMSQRLAKTFRRNVRARMEELGLTQADVAGKLHVTPSFVSQMLSGHRDPGLESLDAFARVLGTNAADLLLEKNLAKAS